MNQELLQRLNEQIALEIHSAQIYLEMAAYFNDEGLDGMGNWMYYQHLEEMNHAMKIWHHLTERGERPQMLGIERPMNEFDGVMDVWAKALEHEKFITKQFDEMMKIAMDNQEYKSFTMLQWFVDEQVEEEDTFGGIVDQLNWSECSKPAVMQMNNSMAARTYSPMPDGLIPTGGEE
ncbi:MAG: ferritin [Tissierellia bacterium]|jgi:ferritin|nr:ferritin [Tissierellia bacterium]